MWAWLGLAFSLLLLSGCSVKETSTVASGGRISPSYQGPAEAAYCATTTSYSGATTSVSGRARYVRRERWGTSTSAGGGGLGSASTTAATHPASMNDIRRAEVRVTDPGGGVVQCTTTDNTGNFTLTLPRGATTYTVSIDSRADNAYLKASVLNRPEQNLFYSLSTTVTPTTATANLGTLTAAADGDIIGAAFNILDQLLTANEYLVSKAGSCSSTDAGCPNFTVAPKVVAYWEKGFNPNTYFGSNSGLSFYLPSYSRLFILGGINGDVNSSDTDHFDNSVIIHEYGHFLEDSMFVSDSPGGSHDGNKVIDPRLAWSEGWGNFFQAAVLNQSVYVDTMGNDDGTTRLIYYANLETATATQDNPVSQGEGNFREFSVTRLLWDAVDNAADTVHAATDNISDKFVEIWAALRKTSHGFRDPNYAFRNVGLLHIAHDGIAGASDWSSLRTIEYQDPDTREYARYVVTGSTCSYSITPACGGGLPACSGSLSNSDLFRNNDFYHIHISSGGTYTILLNYSDANGAGAEADLDLYVYNEDYHFGTSSDILGRSDANPDGNPATAESESVTVSLSPGNYLINVNAYVGSGAGTQANYTLKLNGAQLCPGTL